MKTTLTALAILAAFCGVSLAQSLPAGPYLETCTDIEFRDGNDLIATCPGRELDGSPGQPRRTVIQPGWCVRGTIIAPVGYLICKWDEKNGKAGRQAQFYRGQIVPIPPIPELPK